MKKLIIEDYEEVCPKCKGEGFFSVEITSNDSNIKKVTLPCLHCKLKGKINWIDRIKNKRLL